MHYLKTLFSYNICFNHWCCSVFRGKCRVVGRMAAGTPLGGTVQLPEEPPCWSCIGSLDVGKGSALLSLIC